MAPNFTSVERAISPLHIWGSNYNSWVSNYYNPQLIRVFTISYSSFFPLCYDVYYFLPKLKYINPEHPLVLREMQKKGEVELVHCSCNLEEQIVGIFTKSFSVSHLQALMSKLGVCSMPAFESRGVS